MALTVKTQERDKGVYVAAISGRIDSNNYTTFEDEMQPVLGLSPRILVLDMTGLDYISSAGLGVIFHARKVVESNGGSLVMSNLQPQIRKVFEIVKALPKESVFESIEEVDQYLDAIQRKEIDGRDRS
ncbi:MAG: STAS domain-containing protein [Candidatus Omnitrophica bacterium]|nr:STAS domain-containing protein [Candidatus Omnitrophota bacterium]